MPELGKWLIVTGSVLVLIGLFVSFAGKLPGDILIKKEHLTFYFPLTTSILLSIVVSLLFYLFSR
ncbi:MAG: DUF2905 domain-containing protein [Epsilonproteobacteria bacterium]|nr:DUF2905 domain-containing protein [Campylobacterota bacterium]